MELMTSKKRGGVRKVQLERKIWFFLTITEPCCSSRRGYGHTTRTETESLSLFTSKAARTTGIKYRTSVFAGKLSVCPSLPSSLIKKLQIK